jgi:GntR family transcriptional regulator
VARRPTKAEAVADAIQATLAGAPAGAWLPTWAELAAQNEVALGTVDNARKILVERGVIELVPGRGARTPLAKVRRTENDQALVTDGERGFARSVREAGLEPWDETISRLQVKADPEVAQYLGLPVGTEVFRRSRQHGWVENGQRVNVMLSATWLLMDVVEELPVLREANTGDGGMTSRFEDAGYRVWWEVVTYARAADDAEAEWLSVPRGTPVLDIWRRCFDQNARILEVTQRVIDSAKHQLAFRYGEIPPGSVG